MALQNSSSSLVITVASLDEKGHQSEDENTKSCGKLCNKMEICEDDLAAILNDDCMEAVADGEREPSSTPILEEVISVDYGGDQCGNELEIGKHVMIEHKASSIPISTVKSVDFSGYQSMVKSFKNVCDEPSTCKDVLTEIVDKVMAMVEGEVDSGTAQISTERMGDETGNAMPKSIGNFYDELGIKEDVLFKILNDEEIQWTKLSSVCMVNGVIFEIGNWLRKHGYRIRHLVCKIIMTLFDVSICDSDVRLIGVKIMRLVEKVTKMRRRRSAKSKEELRTFERTLFSIQRQRSRTRQLTPKIELCEFEHVTDMVTDSDNVIEKVTDSGNVADMVIDSDNFTDRVIDSDNVAGKVIDSDNIADMVTNSDNVTDKVTGSDNVTVKVTDSGNGNDKALQTTDDFESLLNKKREMVKKIDNFYSEKTRLLQELSKLKDKYRSTRCTVTNFTSQVNRWKSESSMLIKEIESGKKMQCRKQHGTYQKANIQSGLYPNGTDTNLGTKTKRKPKKVRMAITALTECQKVFQDKEHELNEIKRELEKQKRLNLIADCHRMKQLEYCRANLKAQRSELKSSKHMIKRNDKNLEKLRKLVGDKVNELEKANAILTRKMFELSHCKSSFTRTAHELEKWKVVVRRKDHELKKSNAMLKGKFQVVNAAGDIIMRDYEKEKEQLRKDLSVAKANNEKYEKIIKKLKGEKAKLKRKKRK